MFSSRICNISSDVKLSIYDSIHLVQLNHWKQVVGESNIFLQIPYLQALEDSKAEGLSFKYVVFYDSEYQPIGVLSLQIIEISLEQAKNKKYVLNLCHVQSKLLEAISVKALVCGNIFATGENGWSFIDSISRENACQLVSQALDKLRLSEKSKDKTSVVIFKEFWPEHLQQSFSLKELGYKDFQIDMNMVLPIHPDWNNMDDYLQSMVTKFRTKMKGVYKKSEALRVKSLQVKDIKKYQGDLYALYHQVIQQSAFSLGKLSENTLLLWKEQLGDAVRIQAYFLAEELVGFSCFFLQEEHLEATFVGINYHYNQTHAIYQRMLLDMIEFGISHSLKSIRFGRTAEEVKSCMGAIPIPMTLYVRHKNILSHQILKQVIQTIKPSEFPSRYPFRADFKLEAPLVNASWTH